MLSSDRHEHPGHSGTASTAPGMWLMVSPAVIQTQGRAAHSDHILGALVLTVAIIALAEVTRAAGFSNVGLALGMIVLPWLLGGGTLAAGLNNLIMGAPVIVLSIPPGKIENTCDG